MESKSFSVSLLRVLVKTSVQVLYISVNLFTYVEGDGPLSAPVTIETKPSGKDILDNFYKTISLALL